MANVPHSGTSITGGHTNAVPGGAAGFMSGTDKTKLDAAPASVADLQTMLQGAKYEFCLAVRCALTGALPAYAKTGSAGAEVLTATSNGAFPAVSADGVTLAANDPVLIHCNTTSFPDAGVFVVTAIGDASNPWVLTRSSLVNSAAELSLTAVVPKEGYMFAGNTFRLNLQASSITVATTPLVYSPEVLPRGLYGYRIFEEYDEQGSTATIAGAAATTGPFGTAQWLYNTFGTSSGVTYDNNLGTGSRTLRGVATFATGTVNNGLAQAYGAKGIVLATETRHVLEAIVTIPTKSDGTNTFVCQQQIATGGTDGIGWIVELGVIKLWAANASTITKTVTGPTMVDGQYYHIKVIKSAGTNTVSLYVDGALIGSYSSGEFSTTAVCLPSMSIVKSVGTTPRTMLVDMFNFEGYDPLGRGR